MKLIRVTAVDYTTDDPGEEVFVQLTGRDEDGERVTRIIEETTPYFYIQTDSTWPTGEEVVGVEQGYESYDGIPLVRVNTRTPDDAGGLAKDFNETWESDVPYYRRVTLDHNLTGHISVPEKEVCTIDEINTEPVVPDSDRIEPRLFIGDIEVIGDHSKSFEEMKELAEDPISHVTFWDSMEDEYIMLCLDPDDKVEGAEVKRYLEGHTAAESLSDELDRDIHLRRYETEEKLLEGFLALFENRRPDLVSGWNWVDFDWEYILARFEKFPDLNEHRLSDIGYINGYQTERKVDCVPAFDMMDAYCDVMSLGEWRSKRLDYVAKEELDAGKIPDIDIVEDFEKNPDRLAAYNIMDTMLCVALDREQGIHDFFYQLAEISSIQVYDCFSVMRLVDGYIMSQSDDDEILPPQKEKDIPENDGGLVLDPSDGVEDWVGVVDLKSLYPSAIITWNISPETIHWYEDKDAEDPSIDIPWLPNADHAEGGDFSHDDIDFDVMWSDLSEEGLIPKYLKQMFPERDKMKAKRAQYEPGDDEYDVWDRKQYAIKVVMNSFYGVMSHDYWRLGMYGLGDAVTSTSRYALWQGKEIAEEMGKEVYYGDTDSVMVSLADADEGKQTALKAGERLEERINDGMDECVERSGLSGSHPHLDDSLHGTERHCLVYEFEKLYRRFFQAGSKKRYAGRIVWKEGKDADDIDTVGFESQRSDSPELTEDIQPKVINMILAGDGFSEVSEYIQEKVEEIESGDIELYKVGLPGTVNQPLSEYGNTQTARACRYAEESFDANWTVGDDPWIYFIRETPPMTPYTDVLALEWDEELPDGFELDIEETLGRAMKAPLEPILQEVNWDFTELKNGAKTQSAADWSSDDWEVEDEEEEEVDEWGW